MPDQAPTSLDSIDVSRFSLLDLMVLAIAECGMPLGYAEIATRLQGLGIDVWIESLQKAWHGLPPLRKTDDGRIELVPDHPTFALLQRRVQDHVAHDQLERASQDDRSPIRPEELERALPPPTRTLGLSGLHVIGLMIESAGRPLSIPEVSAEARKYGLDFDEAALQRSADRPHTFLRAAPPERWTIESPDPRMTEARGRVRKLIKLKAEKAACERRNREAFERYRAQRAEEEAQAARLERKVLWQGQVLSVQPRIRLTRSYDERSHSYLGYSLRIAGKIGNESREFTVGIGAAAQAKSAFRAGDHVSGASYPVANQRTESVEYYKTSALKLVARGPRVDEAPPPWRSLPPALTVYRERGHRRLDPRTYEMHCLACIWGCRMPVEMIVDPWKRTKRYRSETFCYGPKTCAFYRSGKTRKVPGRNAPNWEEENWVDEDATSKRGPDE